MLADASLADDAAQEVFVKAYLALDQFQMKASFSIWLYRIATNHCLDLLRKRNRQKTESWEALLEKEGPKIEALFSVPPERFSQEQSELLYRLLSYLPETLRTVLVLREIQDLSYDEIAVTLKCSLDAVKSRLKRARKELVGKLRHLLKTSDVK